MELKQVIVTPDGKQFETKAEAMDHLRRPKILEALNKLNEGNDELSNWLIDNREVIENAFDTGTIRRVTKSEKNQYRKALDRVIELFNEGDKKLEFIAVNADALHETVRWPTVKRMDEEEKAAAARQTLVAATEDEELADWILATKDGILAAYSAGVEKRQVNPKAQEALLEYRKKKAVEKLEAAQKSGDAEAIKKAEEALAKFD